MDGIKVPTNSVSCIKKGAIVRWLRSAAYCIARPFGNVRLREPRKFGNGNRSVAVRQAHRTDKLVSVERLRIDDQLEFAALMDGWSTRGGWNPGLKAKPWGVVTVLRFNQKRFARFVPERGRNNSCETISLPGRLVPNGFG